MESDFTMPTYKRAVQLFQEWGFLVEEGPGQDEVTPMPGIGHNER